MGVVLAVIQDAVAILITQSRMAPARSLVPSFLQASGVNHRWSFAGVGEGGALVVSVGLNLSWVLLQHSQLADKPLSHVPALINSSLQRKGM